MSLIFTTANIIGLAAMAVMVRRLKLQTAAMRGQAEALANRTDYIAQAIVAMERTKEKR